MTTSTRPGSLGPFFYDRGVRFAAGLAIVVAIPVAVLFYFQFRVAERPREDVGRRPAPAEQRHRRVDGARRRRAPEAPAHQRAAAHPPGEDRAAGSGVGRSRPARRSQGESVRRVVLHLERARARRRDAGWPTTARAAPAPGWRIGSRKTAPSARAAAATDGSGQDAHGDRRVHRRHRRPQALRAGAAAI